MFIYIDIETIPTQRDDIQAEIAAGVRHPGNISKAETIAKWEVESKPQAIEDAIHSTGLDGTYGEIICLGWAVNDSEPRCIGRNPEDSEAALLHEFFAKLSADLTDTHGNSRLPTWVGHYITGFDLRFIWQRCVVNKVCPTVPIPYDAKPWGDRVFDTKIEWTGMNKTGNGTLHAISKALGYPGKGDLDGSKVWGAIKEGRLSEVMEYCKDDVIKTRLLHKRMTFQ